MVAKVVKKGQVKKGKKAEDPAEETPKEEPKKEPKKEAPKKEEAKKEEAKKEAPKKEEAKKEAPKKEEGKAKRKDAPESNVSPEEKAKLTANALKEILAGIAKPDAQRGTSGYIPDGWHIKYKPALGAYKKFLLTQKEKLTVHELGNGGWKVTKVGDKAPECTDPAPKTKEELWKKQLNSAWTTYCGVTPQHERSIANFTSVLPKGAESTKPDGAKKEEKKAEAGKEEKKEVAAPGKGEKRKADPEAAEESKEKGKPKKKAKKKA